MADTHDRDASSAPEPANENPSFNPFTRFPEMKPIRGVPTLQTMNGVGLSMVGRRDVDPETGTYVKTHCFVFLFIPLMALGAYRVFDAPEGGWYFLGRVPLSSTARRWNWIFALLVAVGIGAGGWFSYTRTPEYKAGVVLAQGDRLAAEGKGREAAGLYRQVFLGKSDRAAEGGQRLLGMLDHPPENMAETAGAFEVLLELHRQDRLPIKDLFDRAMTLATQHEQNDPAGTLQLLEVVAPLASDPQGQLAIRRRILERLVDREPGNIALVSRLATVCEQIGDLARCEAVLTPVKDKLGSSDGAAILGRLYASQGKFDQAYALLQPFVEARLDKLRSAEVLYRGAISAVEARVINMLKSQNAPGFDFEKARNAGPDQVGLMVQEYRDAQMRDDAGVRDAQQQLAAQAAVVPATLDLGMVLLHLAQAQPDADRRRDLLVKAENTFLAIQGVAGDSDRYRLNLGQVYYWLGKAPEAKKQFDDFLEKHNQSADAVSAVSRVLREVGATSEARKILETAYAKETATEAKQNLAASRSVLFTDLDDKILWLGRANPNNPDTQATLLHARGSRALDDGKEAEAIRLFKEALTLYTKLPENEATLNNSAIIHFSLYQLTQDRDQFQRAADKMDRAIRLRPGDSILLSNAASNLVDSIVRDLVGNHIDFKVLKRGADTGMLSYLYTDQASKERIIVRLKAHPGYARVRDYYEKLLVLAPKRVEAYAALEALYDFVRDGEGLRNVATRAQAADLDLEQSRKEMEEYYAGRKDEKRREEMIKALARQKETLEAARKVGGATFAVAAVGMVTLQMGGHFFGVTVEPDTLLRLADEAHAACPCSPTHAMRIEVLTFRAHMSLIRTDPAYARLAQQTRRSLLQHLLVWFLHQPGSVKERIGAHPDVKQAVALKLEQAKAFPDSQGAYAWALLHPFAPAEASKIAARVRTSEFDKLKRNINAALQPYSPTQAMERYYFLLLENKPDEARASLAADARKGIPLPTANK